MTKNKKTIVICASCAFYTQVLEIEKKLKSLGFKILIPLTAKKMKKSGDFKVKTYKPWIGNKEDYKKKAYLTQKHFKEVTKGDMILVLNYNKNGKDGYIGGAVLSEMAIAFYFKKPIYILNQIDESSSFKEEIYGMMPKIINGNLKSIK
jgi:hypothetical protein